MSDRSNRNIQTPAVAPSDLAPTAPAVRIARPGREYRAYTERDLEQIPRFAELPEDVIFDVRVASQVFPFRVNGYIVDLIDWDRAPDDPIYRIFFPQREMLSETDFRRVADLLLRDAPKAELRAAVSEIRARLNPHPSGQREQNVPEFDGSPLAGVQHKYDETVLVFPPAGQVCHAYCTFCFRWAQFVGDRELKFSCDDPARVQAYLREQTGVTDVLVTGGDPMVMKAGKLRAFLEPLLTREFKHIRNIRIGTKSLANWPQRYTSDHDADDMLSLFAEIRRAGKQLAFMAHYDHWRELDMPIAKAAIERIQDSGAIIRTQGPLLANVNDDARVWSKMWTKQVNLGLVPYYMFVERDTGPNAYFEVSLERAWNIYRDAISGVSGLARTVRGPSMSATPGKVEIQGITEINGEKTFAMRFIQARNPNWVQRPFFARFDPAATWIDQLSPAFDEPKFFFEE